MKFFSLWRLVLLPIMCTQGCGLLKNRTITKNSSEFAEMSVTNRSLTSESFSDKNKELLRYTLDVSDKVYDIRIKPTGTFSISPDKGFEGSASEVFIKSLEKSTKHHTENSSMSERTGQQFKDSINFNKQQASKMTFKEVFKTPSWKLVIIGIAGCTFIALLALYRIKKRFA